MTLRLFYVDESHDDQRFCLSAFGIRDSDCRAALDQIAEHRLSLRDEYGLFVTKEIHARDLVAGRGKISKVDVGKWHRSRIYLSFLQLAARLSGSECPRMQTFFHGWRRKAGVVTLVMACAFMGMWVRSDYVYDWIRRDSQGTSYGCGSMFGRIDLSLHSEIAAKPVASKVDFGSIAISRFLEVRNETLDDTPRDPMKNDEVVRRWDWCGFHFGEGKALPSWRIYTCTVPYWAFAIPLTLLSAYLLLWKPRKRSSPI